MRSHWRKLAVVLALFGGAASAQDLTQTSGLRRPCPPADCPAPVPLPQLGPDGKPIPVDPNIAAPPTTEAFAQAGEGGTAAAQAFAPAFFGDLLGVSSSRFVATPAGGPQFAQRA